MLAALTLAVPLDLAAAPKPDRMGVGDTGPYDYGDMGPPATPAIVAAAVEAVGKSIPEGPFESSWDSLREHYQPPTWFADAKFGIFIHWGLYAAPAHHNEWYEKHMYESLSAWHADHFGEAFGYKDFIPLFTAEKWDPDAWAELFEKSGARLVVPTAQHHDNFALWDSGVTPYNAMRMGPRRDLIGDLARAVRKRQMKFGVSNHGIENFTFINPPEAVIRRLREAKADLFDPAWAEFYQVADRSDEAQVRFLADWQARNFELVDEYQPDLLWFDNGVNLRLLDPLKLQLAAYYYNRARGWRKEVSIATKYIAYAPSNNDAEQIGSIIDFEKVGHRSPAGIRQGPWMVDDPIGSTWGYTKEMSTDDAGSILTRLVDTVSKGGFYLLNIAPMADGTIPEPQRRTLLSVGQWLEQNGEAIYGSRPWTRFGENAANPGAPGYHFTVRDGSLYAIGSRWPTTPTTTIASVTPSVGRVERVEVLGSEAPVKYNQDASGLHVTLPNDPPHEHAYVIKITGLKLP